MAKSQRSWVVQLGVLLLLVGVVFAGTLRAAWPYVAGAGAALLAGHAVVALLRLLTRRW